MTQDPFIWATSLDGLLSQVWLRLSRGVNDRHAASRHPTLATVSLDGRPQARTVVLRSADRVTSSLMVYTDKSSGKVRDVEVTPFAALHVWEPSAHLQIRLDAKVTLLSGPAVDQTWERLNDVSRSSYGSTPDTGQEISSSLDYKKTRDRDAFTILHLDIVQIDALHLGPNHRRAKFTAGDNWTGQWIVP